MMPGIFFQTEVGQVNERWAVGEGYENTIPKRERCQRRRQYRYCQCDGHIQTEMVSHCKFKDVQLRSSARRSDIAYQAEAFVHANIWTETQVENSDAAKMGHDKIASLCVIGGAESHSVAKGDSTVLRIFQHK